MNFDYWCWLQITHGFKCTHCKAWHVREWRTPTQLPLVSGEPVLEMLPVVFVPPWFGSSGSNKCYIKQSYWTDQSVTQDLQTIITQQIYVWNTSARWVHKEEMTKRELNLYLIWTKRRGEVLAETCNCKNRTWKDGGLVAKKLGHMDPHILVLWLGGCSWRFPELRVHS